jgi:hypothetical protein
MSALANLTVVASSTLQSNSFTMCYRWGQVGYQLTYLIVNAPTLLWAAYGGYATSTRDIYYILMWVMWWITAGIVYILRQFSSWSDSRPHPECTSDDFGGPSWSTAILADYFIAILFHQVYTGVWTPLTTGWTVLLCCFLPTWLWYTGNASVGQLIQGAGIGALSALLFMYLLIFILLPRFPFIFGELWQRFTGLRHGPTLIIRQEYVVVQASEADIELSSLTKPTSVEGP